MAGKRANGEGSFGWKTIRGIKYRRWRGMIGYDPGSGKPIFKELYALTDAELREKVKDYQKEIETGTFDKPANITVSKWIDYWIEECCGDLKERTINTYKSTIETHIKPNIGAKRLKTLTMRDVQKFVNNLDGISPKSIKNVHGILHHALSRAVLEKYIAGNPADNITLPKVERKEANFIAGNDLKKFLAAAAGNPYYREIMVSVFTGMRQGELMGLQWDCIDFDNGTILIKRNLQLVKGEYKITTTKNDKQRLLSPAPVVMDILKEQRREQRNQIKEQWGKGEKWDSEYVFTRQDGRNIAKNTLYMNFKRILKSAGLPETIHYHDLRHSYAVLALEAGDNLKEIQAALGHYSAAFTANTYAHVSATMRKESAERQQTYINELLS